MNRFLSVILVDDDELSNALNKLTLEEMDIADEIHIFSDAEQALAHLEAVAGLVSDKQTLIFVDMKMPGIDGENFIHRFNQIAFLNPESYKIVILSALVYGARFEYLKSLGVDLIEKPLTPTNVENLLLWNNLIA